MYWEVRSIGFFEVYKKILFVLTSNYHIRSGL